MTAGERCLMRLEAQNQKRLKRIKTYGNWLLEDKDRAFSFLLKGGFIEKDGSLALKYRTPK